MPFRITALIRGDTEPSVESHRHLVDLCRKPKVWARIIAVVVYIEVCRAHNPFERCLAIGDDVEDTAHPFGILARTRIGYHLDFLD